MKKHIKKFIINAHNTIEHFKHKLKQQKDASTQDKEQNIEKPKLNKPESQHIMVEFSLISVVKTTLVILILIAFSKFVGQISTIIILLFIALLLSATFDPTIDWLQRKGVPRALGVVLIYLLALIILAGFLSTLIPLVVSQLSELAGRISVMIYNLTNNGLSDIPLYDKIHPYIEPYLKDLLSGENQQVLTENLQKALTNIASRLSGVAGNVFTALSVFFNGIFNLILVLVLTFFMTVEEQNIENFIKSLFPSKYGRYIVAKSHAVKHKTGNWLRGQLLLSLIMGTLTFIGMSVLNIEFALTLGLFEAVAEFLPVIGPSITAVAAILIALNQSFWQVIAVIIFFVLLQFMEGNVIIPIVMKRAVNLNPVAVITAALVAYQFLGIPGLILAIPSATIISIFVKDYIDSQK